MAGLSGRRGQLVLAGAFVIAATLIGLTLVLTASNYSETLASQDNVVVRGGDAVSTRQAVQQDLTRYFAHLLAEFDDQNKVEDNFTATVGAMGQRLTAQYAQRGRYVNVTQAPLPADDRYIDGTRLSYLDSSSGGTGSPLTKPNGNDNNWKMATDVQVRNMTFVITDVTGTIDPATNTNTAFNLTFENQSGGNWNFLVYEDPGDQSIVIYEIRSPTGYKQRCIRESPEVEDSGHVLDFQTGSITEVNGTGSVESCPALTSIDLDGQHYDLNITNGNGASGRYSLIVDEPPTSTNVDETAFNTGNSAAEPHLYGANVNYQYYSTTVTYNATIQVAPEELR